MKKKRLFGIRLKVFLITFGIISIIIGSSIPISYFQFRKNEIQNQTDLATKSIASLIKTFSEELVDGLITLDYRVYNEIRDTYSGDLVPGTGDTDTYLSNFVEKRKQYEGMSMTQFGTVRDIIGNTLKAILTPSHSSYLYFGFYSPLRQEFVVCLGCTDVPTRAIPYNVNQHVISEGFSFKTDYNVDEGLVIRGLIKDDPYKGEIFVNGGKITYQSATNEEKEILDYWVISEMSMSVINTATNRFIITYIIISAIILVTLFIVLFILLNFLLVRRLKRISTSAQEATANIRKGNFEVSMNEIQKKHPDEIDLLHNDLSYMQGVLKDYVDNLKNAISNEEKIRSELELSSQIQTSSLPQKSIVDDNLSINAKMKPAKEVGGDLYDYFYIDENRFAFFIGDVSGKGVPAALFMMRAETLIKHTITSEKSLGEVVKKINNILCDGNTNNYFITAFIGIAHIKENKLEYVNCGHEPILMKQNGSYNTIEEKSGIPLGLVSDFAYESDYIPLKEGDAFFLYTDGVSEAQDKDSNLFGLANIKHNLNILKDLPISFLTNEMLKVVLDYEEGHDQDDDICIVSFQYKINSVKIKNNIEEMDKVVDFVNSTLKEYPEDFVSEIQIILDELISNVIYYGYKDKDEDIFIQIAKKEKEVTISIFDQGVEFNPFGKEVKESDGSKVGGLGIHIVNNLSSSRSYKRVKDTNIIVISKTINN